VSPSGGARGKRGGKDGDGEGRRRRGPSSVTDAPDGPRDDEPAEDGAARLTRAERRRQRHQASDRARALNPRQRALLGHGDAGPDLPETAPPRAPRPPSRWQRHDALVVALALALFAGGALAHRAMTRPRLAPFSHGGLALERPAGWLPPVAVPAPPLRLAADAPLDGAPGPGPYHVRFAAPLDPLAGLEVRVQPRGGADQAQIALGLGRAARYGEAYWAEEGESRTIAGRDWLRTRFRYAAKPVRSAPPVLAAAIEYAAVLGDRVYVVTFHGAGDDAEALEALIAPTLALAAGEAP
jgi:hypothetical protein